MIRELQRINEPGSGWPRFYFLWNCQNGHMKKYLILLSFSWLFLLAPQPLKSQLYGPMYDTQLTNRFYESYKGLYFWFREDPVSITLRRQLPVLIEESKKNGLIAKAIHPDVFNQPDNLAFSDSVMRLQLDRYYTDAALRLLQVVYGGEKEGPWVSYDAVSEKITDTDREKVIRCLLQVRSAEELVVALATLEPADSIYLAFKNEYQRLRNLKKIDSAKLVRLCMNYYRWMTHFNFGKMIVINLPAARLFYFENNRQVLQMKTILGKTSTPSPRFAAWCDQAILYPYWYVPRSITFNEYLPLIRRNPSWLDAKNMQVIDGNGKVVDHHKLNWSAFHSGYFPYTIRQSTGCDNALGVIKFNITTPYGVYLHDTNNKSAFLSNYRYLSHGCIRLEDPYELGFHLLEHTLDTAFLQSCYRQQKPVYEKLKQPIPIFTVYMPAWPGSTGNVIYYKDVYRLLR